MGAPHREGARSRRKVNLADPGTLKKFLASHGISASKGLGQHFLCSGKVVEAISLRFDGFEGLLEIGPGPGVLTSALSVNVQRFIALELDPRMQAALRESAPSAEVRLVDALQSDLAAILSELPQPRGVVSNLPYYITGALLTHIAEARSAWDKAVLMMQREVAIRILAKAGSSERGSLSVYLQSQFEIEKVIDVPPGAFVPPPKVDSVVLEFRPKATEFPPSFFAFVRGGFRQPRKTLANNLAAMGIANPQAELARANLDGKVRPHMLTLEEWIALAEPADR